MLSMARLLTYLRPRVSDGLLTIIEPSQAPAIRSDVATSCSPVGKSKSRSADPRGHVTSLPVKHDSGLLLSPVARTVLSADIQYLG